MAVPRALSVGEETLALHLRAHNIPFEREVLFAPGRKFRFDFVIPHPQGNIAVEVDGGTWNAGRHARGMGYQKDCEKLNLAVLLGYRVLRYTTQMVDDGTAINDVLKLLSR